MGRAPAPLLLLERERKHILSSDLLCFQSHVRILEFIIQSTPVTCLMFWCDYLYFTNSENEYGLISWNNSASERWSCLFLTSKLVLSALYLVPFEPASFLSHRFLSHLPLIRNIWKRPVFYCSTCLFLIHQSRVERGSQDGLWAQAWFTSWFCYFSQPVRRSKVILVSLLGFSHQKNGNDRDSHPHLREQSAGIGRLYSKKMEESLALGTYVQHVDCYCDRSSTKWNLASVLVSLRQCFHQMSPVSLGSSNAVISFQDPSRLASESCFAQLPGFTAWNSSISPSAVRFLCTAIRC